MEKLRSSSLSILTTWVLVFLSGILWESLIRIYMFHSAWSVWNSFIFIAANLSWGLLCAVVFGLIHLLILFLLARTGRAGERLRRFFLPTSAVSLAIFLAFAALYEVNFLPDFKGAAKSAAVLVLLLLIYFVLRAVAKVGSKWNVKKTKATAVAVLLLLPVILTAMIQYSRNRIPFAKTSGSIRHIVLISIDTLRHDYVSAYGTSNAKTPVMDRVASEGILFQVAVAPVPETGPSHATMLTGKSPLSHGCLMNGHRLRDKHASVAVQLRKAGFQTGGFISGFPLKAMNSSLDRGFQTYNDQLALKDYFQEIYLGRLADRIPLFSRGIYRQAPQVVEPALKWLSANADRPFFLFLHFYDPHYPYGRKNDLRDARHPLMIRASKQDLPRQKRLYAGEVELVDSQIARVIELLKSRGIYDETLLIIVGDHGESLGEHNYYYDHERYVYDQLLRVPLIVRCPARIPAAQIVKQQVGVLDIYKTIVGSAGLTPAVRTEGYDLLEITKQVPPDFERFMLSHNFFHHVTAIRSNKWKLIETKRPRRTRYELYDLENDAREEVNVSWKERKMTEKLLLQMKTMVGMYGYNRNAETEELTSEQKEGLRSLGYLD